MNPISESGKNIKTFLEYSKIMDHLVRLSAIKSIVQIRYLHSCYPEQLKFQLCQKIRLKTNGVFRLIECFGVLEKGERLHEYLTVGPQYGSVEKKEEFHEEELSLIHLTTQFKRNNV